MYYNLASLAKSDLSTFKTLPTTAHLPETVQYVDNSMSKIEKVPRDIRRA